MDISKRHDCSEGGTTAQDEHALWAAVEIGEQPRDAGERLGIPPKRVLYLCNKWADQGRYEWGVSVDLGWPKRPPPPQHTPGPWIATQGKVSKDWHVRPERNRHVTIASFGPTDEGEANARLGAAGPELLEAAERIAAIDPAVMTTDEFEWCGYCFQPKGSTLLDVEDGWSELPHASDCPGVALRAAIAKAKGEA